LERTTAQGIYNKCAKVTPGEEQPGDIIFFTGTYNSGSPVTHVGIVVTPGIMVHAGDPINYASYTTSYWQLHFYAFGRLAN
jgi:cell wall-associated NlpC family hydrolase